MKWFKHFTDSNRSQEMLCVKRELGMAGVGCLWNLVESCAGLMEKTRDEKYSEAHCHFTFDVSYLANVFGCKLGRVPKILETFQRSNQLQFSTDGFIVKIEMPKLLEWLDRDTDRARPKRGQAEPRGRIELDKELDKDLEPARPARTAQSKKPMTFYYQEADFFRGAVVRFGQDRSEELKAHLGGERWKWFLKIGSSRIRAMPSTDFGRKDLAYALKCVAEADY